MPDPATAPASAAARTGAADRGPLILGFDCSGPWCAAALIRGGDVLAQVHEDMPRGQAERLMVLLEALLAGAAIRWGDLAAIGVGVGPGNFTGTRIAVAAARGLALALNVPAISVGRCEAAAHGLPRPVRVTVPTRRDAVFWQDFTRTGLPPTPDLPRQGHPGALPPGPAIGQPVLPLAEAVARIAALRLHDAAGQPDGAAPSRPAPIYLRPADAAPPADPPPPILPG